MIRVRHVEVQPAPRPGPGIRSIPENRQRTARVGRASRPPDAARFTPCGGHAEHKGARPPWGEYPVDKSTSFHQLLAILGVVSRDVALAQLTGRPIIPVSWHAQWKIRLNSWHRFLFPASNFSSASRSTSPAKPPRPNAKPSGSSSKRRSRIFHRIKSRG